MVRERRLPRSAVVFAAVLLAAVPASLSADDTLTLRVNDAKARPGELVEVVIRTYEPQGVGQGQICLQVGSSGGNLRGGSLEDRAGALGAGERVLEKQAAPSGPLQALEGFVVLSEAGDAVFYAVFDAGSQTADLFFASPSGTINQSDGPLAIFYFRVAPDAAPGIEVELRLVAAGSALVDPDGEALALELRSGELEILAGEDPVRLEVVGDRVEPGDVAGVVIETDDDLRAASGQIALRYEPLISGGPAAVLIRPHQGQAAFDVDVSTSGWVVISFVSPAGDLRWHEGEILAVDLPTSEAAPQDYRSPVWLDAGATYLVGPDGGFLPVELRGDEIELDD
jgi:hypothetical protein